MLDVETNVARQMELDADDARYRVTEGVGLPVPRTQLIHDTQEDDNVTYYAKAAFNGSVYTSELRPGESWTPYVRVKRAGTKDIAKVLHFIQHKRTKRMRAVCRRMHGDRTCNFFTSSNKRLTHVVAVAPTQEFFSCDVDDLEDRLYGVKQFLTEMPYAELRGFYHNDAA